MSNSNSLIICEKIPAPDIPELWNFNKADKKFDESIYSWRRLTTDVTAQLWIFYNKLARPGQRTDLVPNGTRLPGWHQWLESKGIGVHTAIRHFQLLGWLPKRELIISNKPAEVKPGEYRTVIIDPPWPYGGKYNPDGHRVTSPYPEMTIEAISQTPYPFADNCILWLWTTHKFLPASFELLQDWGFDYKATLVWNKDKMGIGFWLRMQCEFCLLAIKGEPEWKATNIRDIITEKGREHSRKPEKFYEIVLNTCPEPIGEAFQRQKRKDIIAICGDEPDKYEP